jgi:hypothetical protein
MLDSIIVTVIVIIAAFLVVRSFYRTVKDGECSCAAASDCSGCDFEVFEKDSSSKSAGVSQFRDKGGSEAKKEF